MASFICLFVFPLRLWTSVKSKHLNSSSGRWYDLWRSFGIYLFIFPAFLCCDLHICWFGHLVQLYFGVPLAVYFWWSNPHDSSERKEELLDVGSFSSSLWVTRLELGEACFFFPPTFRHLLHTSWVSDTFLIRTTPFPSYSDFLPWLHTWRQLLFSVSLGS